MFAWMIHAKRWECVYKKNILRRNVNAHDDVSWAFTKKKRKKLIERSDRPAFSSDQRDICTCQ